MLGSVARSEPLAAASAGRCNVLIFQPVGARLRGAGSEMAVSEASPPTQLQVSQIMKAESGLTISKEENGGCHGGDRHGPRGESGCG